MPHLQTCGGCKAVCYCVSEASSYGFVADYVKSLNCSFNSAEHRLSESPLEDT